MAIVDTDGKRRTVVEAAKLLVMSATDKAEFWESDHEVLRTDELSAGERRKIEEAVQKQIGRVAKLLTPGD